jgi:hypothetical protein
VTHVAKKGTEVNLKGVRDALAYADRVMDNLRRDLAKIARGERLAKIEPTSSEPEGARPGRKPATNEPDDPTSPPGLMPAVQPIGTPPSSRPSSGSARSTPDAGDDHLWRLTLQAAAMNLSRMVPRPISDLRDMLAQEVDRICSQRSIDRAGALLEAQNVIFTQVRSGLR